MLVSGGLAVRVGAAGGSGWGGVDHGYCQLVYTKVIVTVDLEYTLIFHDVAEGRFDYYFLL